MERKASGKTTYRMKRSPVKVLPLLAGAAVSGLVSLIGGGKKKKKEAKLAAGRKRTEAIQNMPKISTAGSKDVPTQEMKKF